MRPSPFGSLRLRQYCYEQMNSLRRGPLSDSHSSTCLVSLTLSLLGHSPNLNLSLLRDPLCVCVCVCVLVTQSCPTVCNPMDCSPLGSSVHGILQARILEGCHFLLQGIFPTQGLNSGLLHCWQILYHLSHQGSPLRDPRTSFLRAS